MINNKIYLVSWSLDGEIVKLFYCDGDIVRINKVDFNRAFGAIVSADKSDIIRDFSIA